MCTEQLIHFRGRYFLCISNVVNFDIHKLIALKLKYNYLQQRFLSDMSGLQSWVPTAVIANANDNFSKYILQVTKARASAILQSAVKAP